MDLDIEELFTLIDFVRYGISKAEEHHLYYGHGTDNAWDEMIALIFGTLSLPLDVNPQVLQARLTPEEKLLVKEQLEKRIFAKIPVPYLTHIAYFAGLKFYVDERVLIPRSPFAELINRQFSPWIDPEQVHAILDLCTGSGCMAIAAQYAFPEAEVAAVDISSAALEVARLNCQRHGMENKINLCESDCWEKIPHRTFDLIIANPPYVGLAEMNDLPLEYKHEPRLALEAAQDGLAVIEKILSKAHDYLSRDGILVMEVGNSEALLCQHYPEVPFTWLDLECGGQGVFLLTQAQLQSYFGSRK